MIIIDRNKSVGNNLPKNLLNMYDTAYAISVMNVYLQPSMNWHGFYDLILVSIKVIIRKGGQRLSVYSHEVSKKYHIIIKKML